MQALLAGYGTGGSGLYLLLVLMFCTAFAALPVVKVPVTARSPGVLRPVTGNHEIRAGGDGIVVEILVGEHERVIRGRPLVRAELIGAAQRAAALDAERRSARALVDDLELLTGSSGDVAVSRIRTRAYRLALERHAGSVDERRARAARLRREVERAAILVERAVIPSRVLEELRFDLAREVAGAAAETRETLIDWETELSGLRMRLSRIDAEAALLRAEVESAELVAPVTGTVEKLAPLSRGSRLMAGDLVAVVSPETTLVAAVYADSHVAALVERGARVRLEVEAYPSARWGFATGRVTNVPPAAVQLDGGIVYPLILELEQDFLTLPNGRRGELRKGMTLQARFVIAHRSLWSLLRGEVDDWLDPATSGG